jgi:hypothetical protein
MIEQINVGTIISTFAYKNPRLNCFMSFIDIKQTEQGNTMYQEKPIELRPMKL